MITLGVYLKAQMIFIQRAHLAIRCVKLFHLSALPNEEWFFAFHFNRFFDTFMCKHIPVFLNLISSFANFVRKLIINNRQRYSSILYNDLSPDCSTLV
jgi:hypothetical protein